MLRDSVVVVVRTRPRAKPLAMITMRKSTHGFPFVSHIWVAYGAPLKAQTAKAQISDVAGNPTICLAYTLMDSASILFIVHHHHHIYLP